MRDFISIGPTPPDEDCAQVGAEDYARRAKKECIVYANQLKRMLTGGSFQIKSFDHEFGSYYEVCAIFETDTPDFSHLKPSEMTDQQLEAWSAWEAEANGPLKWDEEARKELGL